MAAQAKLALSATLLAIWALARLLPIPVLGKTALPLLIALLIYRPFKSGNYSSRAWHLPVLALCIALLVVAFWLVPAQIFETINYSPYFVVPVWGISLVAVIRQSYIEQQVTANKSFKPNPLRGSA